jgi:hypothetical protein
MALIHRATLAPTKLELLTGWLPSRSWSGGPGEVASLGAYRFDDPAGAVGIESMILRTAAGSVLHVPMTYRGAPLAGAEEYLIGTIEHSVLGRRWVYDGCGDPVWATALATAVLTGGTQVEELVAAGDGAEPTPRPSSATVVGSGTPGTLVGEIVAVTGRDEGPTTVVRAGRLELVVVRVVGTELPEMATLTGQWSEGGPAVLAGVRPI